MSVVCLVGEWTHHLNNMNHPVTDEGAKALASALEKNTSLRLLVLTENRITDEGAFALGRQSPSY